MNDASNYYTSSNILGFICLILILATIYIAIYKYFDERKYKHLSENNHKILELLTLIKVAPKYLSDFDYFQTKLIYKYSTTGTALSLFVIENYTLDQEARNVVKLTDCGKIVQKNFKLFKGLFF